MKFVDEAVIEVIAGSGGNGCISFRREKFVPKGGPDGGDGGNGGSIFLIGKQNLQTLADLEYKRTYRAEKGEHGKGKGQHGKNGKDLYIPVPLGTDALDETTKEYLGEIIKEKATLLVVQGGKGGRGNERFKSPTNQAPRIRELGNPGQRRKVRLILRLLADVGIVGLPNAGKSTLLKKITQAQPKIAPYPFTTLTPNLGVLQNEDLRWTVADLPGIIEDAHKGKGLGLRFLRHIERNRVLIFLIDITSKDPLRDFEILKAEINSYNPEILKKPKIIAFNKIDLIPQSVPLQRDIPQSAFRNPIFFISALTGEGIGELLAGLRKIL